MLNRSHSKILIMTAVDAEQQAVLRGLDGYEGADVQLAGVGPASAAASTATALARAGQTADGPYSLVLSAGIGGGFAEVAGVGSLVVASEIIAADLGAETPDGFAGVDELGFGSPRIAVADELAARWAAALREAGLPVHHGPILTLSTVTGTAETAQRLAKRYPGAGAEAMEGFGVAEAARQFGVPVLELRAVSNAVGPRQRELWKIGDALQALEQACAKLPEVLQS
ncbi:MULTISPECIES: futalosine hydrolase [Paenibacillus]|uniref:Futalosine hydrolase n=1 Tax=Paenibacillus barengoltzii J12 TaxID=935846 RepID=A0ABY1LXP8_9BACL|nr:MULTISPECIES: futalosine hydrolase [Paenibacillus]SMF27833.1 futalosine hydrolase [Paenibacillus barengoltzii J12]SMF29424.1 futalosine hydrolase [Paenibacillus barengoltzii]